eukprot:gene35043-43210_t
MDSDAVIDKRFRHIPISEFLLTMQKKLSWDVSSKPIVFNQDGSCWWCSLVVRVGYNVCLNAGTVVWYRHARSEMVLNSWWDASMDPYEENPIKRFALFSLIFNPYTHMIMFAGGFASSGPGNKIAKWPIHMQARIGFSDWCLSHLPEAGCFISHYCANSNAKQVMKRLYEVGNSSSGSEFVEFGFTVNYLNFE